MVGGVACANHRGTRRTRGAIPGLALGVGHRGYADRFAWQRFPLRSVTSRNPGRSGAVLETPAVIAGLNDIAVVGEFIEERGRHFGSPNTLGHSPKARLVVTTIEVRS